MKIFTLDNSYIEKELSNLGNNVYVFPFTKTSSGEVIVVEKKLYKIIKVRQPHIFWYNKQILLQPSILEELRNILPNTKFVFWLGDQRGGVYPVIRKLVKYIDLLLVNNEDYKQYQQYKNIGIKEVKPFYDSIDPNEFFYLDKSPKYDIVFGGNNFKHSKFPLGKFRYDLVNELNNRFNIAVHGCGWNIPTKERIRGIGYNYALNTGHMTLGCNHYDIAKYYEERFWQCIGSGRMHITRYIPRMEEDFENHKHLVWFNTIEECCDLVSYYRKNENKCEKIGKCGRSLLISNHTHTRRVKQLVEYFRDSV